MFEPCGNVETKLGTLKAYVRDDLDYPGIDIRLVRDGKEIFLAWVESVDYQLDPVITMRLYGDCQDDEHTHECCITSNELDAYFKEV